MTLDCYSTARTLEDFQSEIRKSLVGVRRWAEDERYGWLSLIAAGEDIVGIAVGGLHIFFREAYGFDRQGYIQYGYSTQDPGGAVAEWTVGEWRCNYDSSYTYHLGQPDGIRLLTQAADKVLNAIVERHGNTARCRSGYVQVEFPSLQPG
jgi:hypothetical protein